LAADPVSYTPDYAAAVRAVADVDEWMRWFAMNTLVDNSETNLSNGDGDDFNFYFGQTTRGPS
jgi:spore coat protein CotH